MIVYMIMEYYEWQEFKKTGIVQKTRDFPNTIDWISEQIKKRTKTANFYFPIYTYLSKPKYGSPPRRVVLKIRIDDGDVLEFDDNLFIYCINCMNNNLQKMCCLSRKEDEEEEEEDNIKSTLRECLTSYERMFDVENENENEKRSINWVGAINKRAFIPYLKREMIRKVWIYRNNTRLRRRVK